MNNLHYRFNRFLDQELSTAWAIIGIILYIYGFRMRSNLFIISNAESKTINNWDIIVNFFSEIYLQIYFIVPICLYLSLKNIQLDSGFPLLIRLGSYNKWIIFSLIQFIKRYLILTCIMAIVVGLLLINVPFDFKWSVFSGISKGLPNSFSSNVISHYVGTPIFALLLELTLSFLFFVVIHLFLAIIYVVTNRKLYSIICAILLWIMCIVSFKLFPPDHPMILLPSYFNLIHGVKGFGNLWIPFTIVTFCLFLLGLICFMVDKNLKRNKFTLNWKYTFYCFLVLLAFSPIIRQTNIQSIQDLFTAVFYGGSQVSFNFLAFLSYIIIFYGYVYLIILSLNNELSNFSYYKALRYGSLTKWIWNCYIPILKSNFFLLLYLFSFVLLVSFFYGGSLNNYFSSNISFLLILYHFFINGYLQIMFYILFAFIVGWYTKNMFYGFISIVTLSIFMLPGLNFIKFIPSGFNSMGYLLDEGSPYNATFILLIYLFVQAGLIYFLLNQKDFDI